jgi:phage tail-like protein
MSGFSAQASIGFGGTAGQAGELLPLARTFRFRVTLIWSPSWTEDPSQPPPVDAITGGTRICSAGFQECSGLAITVATQAIGSQSVHHEGGNNGYVHQLPGPATFGGSSGALQFKRGMMYSVLGHVQPDLWYWVQAIAYRDRDYLQNGPYCDGLIQLLGIGDEVVAKWQFQRGLPVKIVGPTLSAQPAQTGGIAIEELDIAPARLWLTR